MKDKQIKIKRDDNVLVVTGKDKGKSGRVLRIDTAKGRVFVQGLNMVKKAIRPKKQNEKGGIIDIEAALDVSNVMIVCRKCGPTRIGYKVEQGGKTRVCRKCGEAL